LVKKLPYRRGFNNPFRIEYEVVNLGDLERVPAGQPVTPDVLRAVGLIRRNKRPVKVLAGGSLQRPVDVTAHAFSAAARAAIEAAGGTVAQIGAAEPTDD
jgi:large subunit ribosomal protein L15